MRKSSQNGISTFQLENFPTFSTWIQVEFTMKIVHLQAGFRNFYKMYNSSSSLWFLRTSYYFRDDPKYLSKSQFSSWKFKSLLKFKLKNWNHHILFQSLPEFTRINHGVIQLDTFNLNFSTWKNHILSDSKLLPWVKNSAKFQHRWMPFSRTLQVEYSWEVRNQLESWWLPQCKDHDLKYLYPE